MTITSDQIIMIAGLLGAIAVIWGIVSKPFKAINDIKDKVDKMSDDMNGIIEAQDVQSDMISALLTHAATNNNTGGMQDALDKFQSFYRHRH